MKRILFGLFLAAIFFPLPAQNIHRLQPEASTQRILIRPENGATLSEIADVLRAERAFVPLDERMWLAGNQYLVGWFDPAQANAPRNSREVYAMLERLTAHAFIETAHPFLQSPNGALFGVTDEMVIKLHRHADLGQLQALARLTRTRLTEEDRFLPRVYRLHTDANSLADPLSLAVWLRKLDQFAYVDLNYVVNPAVATNDPFFIHQWSLDNTGSPIQGNGTPGADMSVVDAWTVTTGDPNVRIAIIDSGSDTSHVDLVGNLLPGFDATGNNSQGAPSNAFPEESHGTNCAGIVAAMGENNEGVAGVCYDCKVVPIKVFYYLFNPFGSPLPFSDGNAMSAGISWAWQNAGAQILSNSWAVPDFLIPGLPGGSSIVEDAIGMALDSARGGKGAFLFFSSGNDGGKPLWPGRLAGCFSVNATSMCDERKFPGSCDGQNWEGNWGDSLDLSAPGVRVASTDMTGTDGYDPSDYNLTFGGTSAACPNAAGVMGLVLSVNPNLNVPQAHVILESTCDRVGGYTYFAGGASGSWSEELGHGRINAHAAVLAAQISLGEDNELASGLAFSVGPNPARGDLRVQFTLPKACEVELEAFDLQGRRIYFEKMGQLPVESYSHIIPHSSLQNSSGMIFLKLSAGGVVGTKKLLVVN